MIKSYTKFSEGREFIEPVKGKDGRSFILFFDSVDWVVLSLTAPKAKLPPGAMDWDDGCEFATYREAWLFFLDCLEGKKPDCETWKPPEAGRARTTQHR